MMEEALDLEKASLIALQHVEQNRDDKTGPTEEVIREKTGTEDKTEPTEATQQDEESEELESGDNIAKPRKYTLKLKQNENGNLLTVHHTLQEKGKVIRVPLTVCCFSERSSQFVAIDRRGNIFAFDLAAKRHWRLLQQVPKASVVKQSMQTDNHYFIGTKGGGLVKINIDKSIVLKAAMVSKDPILQISYPTGQSVQCPNQALLHTGHEVIRMDLKLFKATHRLDFDKINLSLKFACYLPFSEQIFTCFTDDSLHIWSGTTLNTIRVAHPIKVRDRKLRLSGGEEKVPEFSLSSSVQEERDELQLKSPQLDYANGLITAYSCQPNGNLLCLATLDGYLLILSTFTFEVQSMFRLRDFVAKECSFLVQPKETLIVVLTTSGAVVLLDCQNVTFKMIVKSANAFHISVGGEGKLLAVVANTGEVELWSIAALYNTLKSQEQAMQMLKTALTQGKAAALSTPASLAHETLNENARKLLKRERLLNIVQEYGCYPAKYRRLIWCALLELPYNRREFQDLLKLGTPAAVQQSAKCFRLKDESTKRSLVKVWSCLAQWCKVFAHATFLPKLIFPFVKLLPKNALVTFEICASLLLNHFPLWFEFHPLEPANYLGMCENVLQYFDASLCKFYSQKNVAAKDYAWSLLSSAFSEVLDDQQWLCLWDNILSSPPYFPIFCCIAYNMLQREVIVRLPDKGTIVSFFREQNPVDVRKLITKAKELMQKCPAALHPRRYINDFEGIPKNVYPKFLNYPRQYVAQHEAEVAQLQVEHRAIDKRIRELELEEYNMMEQLQNKLKEEEHSKRMKEMERLYRETLKREEERIAFQRKMLLLYQKEIRSRKGQVLTTLQETEQRKKSLQMERELEALTDTIERERLRNDTNVAMAEDEIRNQNLELYAQKYAHAQQSPPLAQKYYENIQRLSNECTQLTRNLKELTAPLSKEPAACGRNSLHDIEKKIDNIQREFMDIVTK